MSQNQSHVMCQHESTKAARAKCRAERKKTQNVLRDRVEGIVTSYYDNSADAEEIGAAIYELSFIATQSESLAAAREGYYNLELSLEDIIALVQQAVWEV
jgi:hypothetical protein